MRMVRMRILVAVLGTMSAIGWSAAAAAQNKDQDKVQGKVRSEMLVSTDWLAKHLQDDKVLVIHVGGEKSDYEAGHIPGARWIALKDFIKNEPGLPPSELYSPEELKKAFDAIGVDDKKRIILYANDWPPMAARAFFTLDYMGHGDHTALLDGGMEKWLTEKRELSKETTAANSGNLTLHVRKESVTMRDQVEKLGADTLLLDARPLMRYRVGHIPGASTFFWEKNLVSDANPVLLPPEQLRKKMEAAGMKPGKKVVVYCEVGHQSSFAYFVSKYLGYDVTNYDGSFSEWKSSKEPIVKGDAPR